LALWSLYTWTIATPTLRDRNGNLKGTDFLHFYTLGLVANEHRAADLYDMDTQTALATQHVPDAVGIRYLPLYPPHVSIVFAPFAHLPYAWALALWWVLSSGIYAVCCCSIWRACTHLREHGVTVALLAAASPAFFNLIAWGQTSAVALACFSGVFFLLRDRRDFVAGLVLGCLIFKPQLGLAAAVVFVALGAWRIVAGAVLSAVAQLSAGALYYGIEPVRMWLRLLWNVRSIVPLLEPRPYQTHCLRTFWSMILPWGGISLALYVISALIVLGWAIQVWRQNQSFALRMSSLLLATVLVAPHLTVYDLVIVTPALLLMADWLIGCADDAKGIGTTLYFVYLLPLLAPLTKITHVQLSVIALIALAWMIWRQSREEGPSAREHPLA
jgi:hypothetical protein